VAKKVRIHLTPAQLARLNPATIETTGEICRSSLERDLAVTSFQETTPPSQRNLRGPAELSPIPSESDLVGSGATRPTAVVRIL